MTPLELRLHLHRNGYCPLPLIGKAPVLNNWQQKTDSNESEIELWSSIYPGATNTGALTRMMPTLDLDILNGSRPRRRGDRRRALRGAWPCAGADRQTAEARNSVSHG